MSFLDQVHAIQVAHNEKYPWHPISHYETNSNSIKYVQDTFDLYAKEAMKALEVFIHRNLHQSLENLKGFRRRGGNSQVADFAEEWFFRHPHAGPIDFWSWNMSMQSVQEYLNSVESIMAPILIEMAKKPYLGQVMRQIYKQYYP